jgi:hypothetical protein
MATNAWNESVEVLAKATTAPKASPAPPTGKTSDPVADWGLNRSLSLKARCAEFYLSTYLDVMGVAGFDCKLAGQVAYLEDQFSRYSDMALGGELRHSKRFIARPRLPKPIADAFRKAQLPSSRHVAWGGWRFLRQRYGTMAIRWAVDTFLLKGWGGGYGGPPWAGIAETLWRYEVGIYSPTTFIDTCWGQQHNGGSFFNKVWSPSGLQTVLDAKQVGDAAYLATLATDETRTVYEQFEKGEL